MKLLSSDISPRILPQRILKATAGKLVLLLLAVGLVVTLCDSAMSQEPSPTPQPSPGKNVAEKSVTEKSATEKNTTQKSATEKNATEKNSAEKNASEKSSAEKNATEKNASDKGTAEENSTPAATNQARSRRIVTTETPERSEDITRNRLETKKDPTAAVDKTAAHPELVALREEIESASTPQEKLRLRLSLVDQLVAAGRKQDAINELHSMAGEEQFDPPGFYNIANALARLGDSETAITTYRKAISQRNGRYSRALNNLGVVLIRLGRWDEAYDALFSALQFESFHYAEASYNLGRVYAARGQTDLAIREWKRAVKVDPDHTAAAQALAKAGVTGTVRVASSYRAGKSQPAGTAMTSARPIAKSTKATSSSAPSNPQPSSPRDFTVDAETYNLLQRARNAREHDRNEEAVQAFRLVISRMGGYFLPANLELAYVLITLKRNDEAMTSLQAVADRDGSYYPIVYFHLGRLYEFKGEMELAERNYEQVISLFGQNNPQFLLELSRVREKRGNFEGALTSTEAYAKEMERMGQKPDWTDARVAYLRKRLADSKATPKK